MKRVIGIGGVFFRARDPVSLRAWYQAHLGIDVQAWGGAVFQWADAGCDAAAGSTIWSIADGGDEAFAPGTSPFMLNYRVENVRALVAALKSEGCNVLEKIDDSDFGSFAWVIDPEGNKIELWEAPAGG